MNCNICKNSSSELFKIKILNKYNVTYFECGICKFIQTENPFWVAEAYENIITNLDIGLINRNLYLRETIPNLIDLFFPESKILIDYGGGYGMFVRMMRDMGYNYYRQDLYCENLFAKNFDIGDAPEQTFDILSAFEVFEHLVNPLDEIEKMFNLSSNIIFSTLLTPENKDEIQNWWYLSPLTGQHISLYRLETLEFIAKLFSKKLYTNKNNLHVFSDHAIDEKNVRKIFNRKKKTILNRVEDKVLAYLEPKKIRLSLLDSDYKIIENKLLQNRTN